MTIAVRAVLKSISPEGRKIASIYARYPWFIHAEMCRHRIFSQSVSSARAIPFERMLAKVESDPVIPIHWGKSTPGMQAHEEIDGDLQLEACDRWASAMGWSIDAARHLHALGVHKQIVNRLLLPFTHVETLITSTEWGNFLALRDHPDAEPHMQQLAKAIREVIEREDDWTPLPEFGWHIPFLDERDADLSLSDKLKVSVARCAMVSYFDPDGKPTPREKEFERYNKLLSSRPLHACYDAETEVLTKDGWKRWPYVSETDDVMAVDIRTGSSWFETPSAVHKFEHSGSLIHITSQALDLLVTPNHNLVVSSRIQSGRAWTPYRLMEARYAASQPHRALTSTQLVDGFAWTNSFGCGARAWATLVGFFVGDGHATKPEACNSNRITFHLRKRRKISFLRLLALSLGIDLLEQSGDIFALAAPGIGTWFRKNCYTASGDKILPDGWMFITSEEWRSLKLGLLNSDGAPRRNTWVYSSTSRELLNQLQILAHTRSEAATITWTDREAPAKSCGRINFSNRTAPRVESSQHGRTGAVAEQSYEGLVYCATVSTGALLVRRNGLVAVSGNSPFEHQAQVDDLGLAERHWRNFTFFRQHRSVIECGCAQETN
jgi:hypothetical protein